MVNLPFVGLLRRLSLLDPSAIKEENRLFAKFKGALTENYILTGLIQQFKGIPRYWKSGNKAEVDFLVQHQNKSIPIEDFFNTFDNYIVYHSRNAERTARQMCIDPLVWTEEGPKVHNPSRGQKRVKVPLNEL